MTKFTMWKRWQKCSNNYIQTTCSYHEENICKVSKRSVQNCKRSCAHKRYPLSIYWGWKITKFHNVKKVTKNVQTIILKSHAHLHTMKKTHAKFQNNQYKTVRGVALTRGTRCLYIEVKKWRSSQCGKSDKNNLTIISKPHAHLHTM